MKKVSEGMVESTLEMQADRVADKPPKRTNHVDGRRWQERLRRTTLEALITEYDIASEVDMMLADRIAGLVVFSAIEEARASRGEVFDSEVLIRNANAIRRMRDDLRKSHKARQSAAKRNRP